MYLGQARVKDCDIGVSRSIGVCICVPFIHIYKAGGVGTIAHLEYMPIRKKNCIFIC